MPFLARIHPIPQTLLPSRSHFLGGHAAMRGNGWEERGPIEARPGGNTETDRVREGISEGFPQAEFERVAPRSIEASSGMAPTSLLHTPFSIPLDMLLQSSPCPF
jgi:hypothetical protein